MDARVRKTWIKILALSFLMLEQEVTNKQEEETKIMD